MMPISLNNFVVKNYGCDRKENSRGKPKINLHVALM